LEFNWQDLIDKGVLTYVVYGEEKCPSTGRPHHQYWCHFKNVRSSNYETGKLLECHAEKLMDLAKCDDYCKKDGKVTVLGVRPEQGKRSDLAKIMYEIKENDMTELEIAERWPSQWLMYRRAFREYRDLLQEERTWRTEVRVWWGPTYCGKTHAAKKWLGRDRNTVRFTKSDFVLGYKNAKGVLIDDFQPGVIERDMMLTMCDETEMVVNVKGSEKQWNPRKIAITSNFDPATWYYGEGEDDAVMRRFDKIIHLTKKWKKEE